MTQSEYEERLRRLEEKRRAGIALVEAAYRAEVAALEASRATAAGLAVAPAPPETGTAVRPPRRRKGSRRRPRRTLYEELVAVLDQVPEVFTKDDVTRKLGDAPNRSSVFRILDDLVHAGRLKVHSPGSGRLPTEYRRVQRDSKA